MVIYGDILFLVNLYVDYFLILAVKRFLHLRARRLKMVLGALLGGAFSLISLLPLPKLLTYPLSALFAVLISLVVFFPIEKKALIKASACFFAFSFTFGGIVLLLAQINSAAAVIGGSIYFDISPIMLFIFTVLSYFISLLIDKIRGKNEPNINFFKIVVKHGGKTAELLGKLDTGNTLKEPFSDLPVLVAEKEALIGLPITEESTRLVPFNSIGGNGLLHAIRPDEIYIKSTGKVLNCYLGFYEGKLSHGSWNCLINPQAIANITVKGEFHENQHNYI